MRIHDLGMGNSSLIYDYIRGLKVGSAIPSTMYFGSQSASSSYGKASIFNQFFHSMFTSSSYVLPSELPRVSPSFTDFEISAADVLKVLVSLDGAKAKGLDGIGPSVLKHCALALCEPLCHLFQKCISLHQMPAEWKLHAITPIHKGGDKHSVANYRPISLLCCTSKVLEKLVFDQLSEFLKDSISPVQFGFRRGHSTLQQLLLFYYKLMCRDHSPKPVQWDVVFLDFSKAFDSVPHGELLLKLHRLGVSGDAWLWLRCYLEGRSQ